MLSLNQTEEHPSYIALEQFGDDLYEATDGRLEVEVYPHETLGAQKEVVQLVGDGAVDTAFDDIDHPLRVVNGEAIVGDLFTSVEDSNHLTVLGGLTEGSRHVYTAEGPIVEPSDLSGMKIRVQESSVHIAMINAMGAAATPMSYGEVCTALQSGVLDGAENNEISYMSQHHNEVATHMALTNHLVGLDYVVMNTDLLHSLPDEDREIFQQHWQLASEHHADLWTAEIETAIAGAEDSGTEINDVDKAAFQEALRPVVEKYLDTPQDRELFEAIRREAQP